MNSTERTRESGRAVGKRGKQGRPSFDRPPARGGHSGAGGIAGSGGPRRSSWGTALIAITVSGIVIYWSMRRPNAGGIERFFW